MKIQNFFSGSAVVAALSIVAAGCHQMAPPTPMAPPMANYSSAPMNGGGGGGNQAAQVYDWHQVPTGQQVPIVRAAFDQSGYQLYMTTGETIVVPFENQNMYVMKFGQTSGNMYFVNDGNAPTLYLPQNAGIQNAAAQGAMWYPFPQNFAYSQPVYMGIAPSWGQFVGMGWYPGMSYYGGYWGYHPLADAMVAMVGLHFLIGGHPYYGWNSYHSYYVGHPYSRVYTRTVYNNYHTSGFNRGGFGSHRSFGSTGSFGTRRTFGSGSSSSFGTRRTFGSGSGSSFGSRPSGSFGRSSAGFGSSFGSGRTSSGSFGSARTYSGGSSFGSGRSNYSGGSFGSGRSFGGSSSSSFGGGGSFGGSHSFGGGGSSFGGGRSFGGGFGRRR